MGTTVHRRRIFYAGFVAQMGEERLPKRVMFGELASGKGYIGGQDKEYGCLQNFLQEFGRNFITIVPPTR